MESLELDPSSQQGVGRVFLPLSLGGHGIWERHGGEQGSSDQPAAGPPALGSCLAFASPRDFAEPCGLFKHAQIAPPASQRYGKPVNAQCAQLSVHCLPIR